MTWRGVTWPNVTWHKVKWLLVTWRDISNSVKSPWRDVTNQTVAVCFFLGGNFRGAKEYGRANASVDLKRSAENYIKSLIWEQWNLWSSPRTSCDRALIIWIRVLFLQALELLPSSIEVREVYTFLLNVLEDKEKKRKNCQVLKSLLFAEHLQVGTMQTNFCYPLERHMMSFDQASFFNTCLT